MARTTATFLRASITASFGTVSSATHIPARSGLKMARGPIHESRRAWMCHGKSGSACRFLTLASLENGCSRPGTSSRTTRRFLTVADASGSLLGACFAARRAEARWPLTTSPLADEDGWRNKLADLEVQEERLLDLYLEGKLESDRYESRVSQLKRSRKTAVEELEHIRSRTSSLERLEQDRDALLSHYSQIAVEHLDNLEPEERKHVYKMLGIKFLAHEDGNLEVKWTLGGGLCRDNEPLPPGSSRTRDR